MARKTISETVTDQIPNSKRIDFDIPYNDDSMEAEYDAYDNEQDALEAQEKACLQRVIDCFKELERTFGNSDAIEVFKMAAKTMLVRRKKGKHNPSYDNAILEADRNAPKGQKNHAVMDVTYTKIVNGESTKRRLARLKKAEIELSKLAAAWMQAQRENLDK
jgi:hypothetical protein